MKNIITIIMALGLAYTSMYAAGSKMDNGDSLHINIDRKTKAIIPGQHPQAQGYSLLSDLREIFKSRNIQLSDSTWTYVRNMLNSQNPADTLINLNIDGKAVRIAFNKNSQARYSASSSDSSSQAGSWPADRPRRGTNYEENVHIGRDGIHIKDGSDEVHISRRGVQVIENGNEEVNIGFGKFDKYEEDSTDTNNRDKKYKWQNHSSFGNLNGFNIYLGLNSLDTRNDKVYNTEEYALRPFGSRFVSMGWIRSTDITKGKNARLKLAIGLNFTWYNFMLENSNVWTKGPSQIELVPSPVSLKKSKLTSSFIEIPLIPYLSFKNGKLFDYIGVGGYVGYRLSSHSKTKTSSRGHKNHEYGNFYMTDFRNGLSLQLGIHNFPDLFVNYDFNKLFRGGKGPDVNALSFGIRL